MDLHFPSGLPIIINSVSHSEGTPTGLHDLSMEGPKHKGHDLHAEWVEGEVLNLCHWRQGDTPTGGSSWNCRGTPEIL